MPRFVPSYPTPGGSLDFATAANRVAVLTLDLSIARTLDDLNIGGTALWVVDASSAAASATFFFRDQQTAGVPLLRGLFMRGVAFDRPLVSNAAQAGQWVTIVYTTEKVLDRFEIVNPNVVNSTEITEITPPGNGDTVADVALNNGVITTVLAANADTVECMVQADPSNTIEIRVGPGANVAAARGIGLFPGQSITIIGSAAVSAFASAAGQSVRVGYVRY